MEGDRGQKRREVAPMEVDAHATWKPDREAQDRIRGEEKKQKKQKK